MGLIKDFIISYDTFGDPEEEQEVGPGTGPLDVLDDEDFPGDVLDGIDSDITAKIIDELKDSLGIDVDRPLGIGFKSEYEVEVESDLIEGSTSIKKVDALTYLKGKGYKNVYFPSDVIELTDYLGPKIVVQLKNIMATIGFIDINRTIGHHKDAEFYKGVQKLMEFSMNNGGKITYMQVAKSLYATQLAAKAPKKTYELQQDEMEDLVKTYVDKATTLKGSPLTQNEKNFLMSGLNKQLQDFDDSLTGLQPASSASIQYDPMTGESVNIPEQPAEEPDVEELEGELSGVVDEFIAPREELERKAELEADASTRFARTMNSLAAAESDEVAR